MEIKVNVSKKGIFALALIAFFLIGAIAVYASSNPVVFGHSADEVNLKLSDGTFISLQQAYDLGKLGGSSGFSNTKLFEYTTGAAPDYITTYSWTVPAGVSSIKVRMWGGGGAGGAYCNYGGQIGGGGGGAGGYAEGILAVTPGQVYTINVGAGSWWQSFTVAGFDDIHPVGPGQSSISLGSNKLMYAGGGNAGSGACLTSGCIGTCREGIGGAGGEAKNLTVVSSFVGINGGSGTHSPNGMGGTSPNGGSSNIVPGGGGNPSSTNNAPGGSGAAGRVIIEY